MQVEAIPMLINNDFFNAPLDVKIHLADYKMYGEDSYVFQQKELLHGLYECTYLSMNDRRINGEAFEYLTANNKHIGKALSNVYDIEQKEELSTLTTMAAVAASSMAMEAVASSSMAMQAVLASSTAMEAVLASSTAMEAVLASSTAMEAVLASSTTMEAVAASSTAMEAVASSSTAMQAVLASSTAMQAVLASSTAMQAVAASSTAMEAVLASSTAMEAVLASSTAMQAVAASSTAMEAVLASSTAMQAVLASSTAMQAVAASSTAMQAVLASSTAMQAVLNSSDAKNRIAKSAIALAEICKSREASLYFKNSFHSYRHDILLTLLNSPQYFSKLDTEWYHYGDKAGSTIKVAGDNTIVIPKSMWCYYNRGGYGQLFNGSDQSKIKEIENMSQDYEYLINDIVSFRGMYFRGGPYVRTYAFVFTIKEE